MVFLLQAVGIECYLHHPVCNILKWFFFCKLLGSSVIYITPCAYTKIGREMFCHYSPRFQRIIVKYARTSYLFRFPLTCDGSFQVTKTEDSLRFQAVKSCGAEGTNGKNMS